MWGGFAFGIFGAILAALFLTGVGVIGERKSPKKTDQSSDEQSSTEKT